MTYTRGLKKQLGVAVVKLGFTLIELMVVVAIVSCLSMLALPSLKGFLAKAKRTEAYINLSSLATAQKAYFAEHGKYTKNLRHLGWRPEGQCNYTYGFAGEENKHFIVGQTNVPGSALQGSHVSDDTFTMCAAGIIHGATPDVVCIDHNHTFTILQDALQS